MTSGENKDPYQLNRFLEAQETIYPAALAELRAGRKRSHWMWFMFPQIKGLGVSPTASFYAVKSIGEAEAYLHHPVLGSRLRECTDALLDLCGLSISEIFGYPDDLKFCSSMTLFDYISPESGLFDEAINKYCVGRRDEKTLAILKIAKT